MGIIPTSALFAERNDVEGFPVKDDILLGTLGLPIRRQVGDQAAATVLDGILEQGKGFRIEDTLGQFRIGRKADRTHGTGIDVHSIIATAQPRAQRIAGGRQGDTGIQSFGEHLVDPVRTGRGRRIRKVRNHFLDVRKDPFVDIVTAGFRNIHRLRSNRFETGGDITPRLGQLIIHEGTQNRRLGQQITHLRVIVDIAIGLEALDGQVRTLDAVVQAGIDVAARRAEFLVGREAVIQGDPVLVIVGLETGIPFDIRIETVIAKEAVVVGVILGKDFTDTENGPLSQRITRINGFRIEG